MHLLRLLENQLQKRVVGTLTLGKKKHFREVFFEQEFVYLVGQQFSGKLSTTGLLGLGIPGERLDSARLEVTLQTADMKRQLFPEVLLSGEIIGEEEFQRLIVEQLTEEILDLLFRNSASFHFQEGRVPEYLLECEHITSRTPISLGAIVEELRNRHQAMADYDALVPSYDEIFIVTEKGLALKQQGDTDFALGSVLNLVDGFRSLSAIIKDSYLYEFHVVRAIVTALEQGHIKKTIFPELKGVSTQSLTNAEVVKYLPYFRNAVRFGVDELAARERLAVLYEKTGKTDEAFLQYSTIGDALHRMRKPAKAVKAYQRALELKEGDVLVTDKISKIYVEAAQEELQNRNASQAIQYLEGALRMRPEDEEIFKRLLGLLVEEHRLSEVANLCDWIVGHARKAGNSDFALRTCREVLRTLPGTPLLRKKLINLYLDMGYKDEAIQQLEELARQYMGRGQAEKTKEIVEKIRRLSGGQRDTTELQRSLMVAQPQSEPHKNKKQKRSKVFYAFVGLVLLLVLYQLLGFLVWSGIRQKSALAVTRGKENDRASLLPGEDELHHREVGALCERFLTQFPLHVLTHQAIRLRTTALERLQQLAMERQLRTETTLRNARDAVAEGDRHAAESWIRLLLELDSDEPSYREAAQLQVEVGRCRESAEDLLRRARQLEEAAAASPDLEHWRQAHAAFRELVRKFPKSKCLDDLKVPIWIDSLPHGAELREILAFDEARRVGKTPLVYRMAPGETTDIELSAKGYVPLKAKISEASYDFPLFKLPKLYDFLYELDGPVYERPVLTHGLIVCCTNEGRIYCLDLAKKLCLWDWQLPGSTVHRVVVPPVVDDGGVSTAWSDRRLLRLSPLDGGMGISSRGSKLRAEHVVLAGLPSTALHNLSKQPLVAVGTKASALELYDRRTLEFRGKIDLDDEPTALAESASGDLLIGTQGGALLRLGTDSWSLRRLAGATGDSIVELLPVRDRVVAKMRSGTLKIWVAREGVEPTAIPITVPRNSSICMLREQGKVCVLEEDGLLHVLTVGTEETVRVKLDVTGGTLQALPGSLGIIFNERHSLLLLGADDLSPRWMTNVGTTITTATANQSYAVIATLLPLATGKSRSQLLIYPMAD